MADHLFDPDIIRSLRGHPLNEGDVLLAVDTDTQNSLVDMEDVTKVHIQNGKILNIGKTIDEFNGFDTGCFLCTTAIFEAIEEAQNIHHDTTLSGAIRVLGERQHAKAVPTQKFWIDVDDKTDRHNAELLICNKLKKDTDGPVSQILNRPISLRISKLLLKTGITPNQISVLSFVIGLAGASFFFSGEYFYLILGGILIHIHSVVDGCDGEVARLKLRQTKYGGWLDSVLDRYADAAIILGLVYGYWSINGDMTIWIIGFFALIGSFLNSYTSDKYDSIFKNESMTKRSKFRMGRDVRLLLITIGALTNQIPIMLIILAVMANFEALRRLVVFRNKLDENMQTVDREFSN